MSGETVADDGGDRVYSFRLEEWRGAPETGRTPLPWLCVGARRIPHGLRRGLLSFALRALTAGGTACATNTNSQMDRLGSLSYTLMAEPVLARARTLSSNSKPAVRGLWLRRYHL